MKAKAGVNVFLFLVKDGKVLMSLRENTGWEDGSWGAIAGGQE